MAKATGHTLQPVTALAQPPCARPPPGSDGNPQRVGRGGGMRAAIWLARMRPARVTSVTRWAWIITTSTSTDIVPFTAAANVWSCPPRTESSG